MDDGVAPLRDGSRCRQKTCCGTKETPPTPLQTLNTTESRKVVWRVRKTVGGRVRKHADNASNVFGADESGIGQSTCHQGILRFPVTQKKSSPISPFWQLFVGLEFPWEGSRELFLDLDFARFIADQHHQRRHHYHHYHHHHHHHHQFVGDTRLQLTSSIRISR